MNTHFKGLLITTLGVLFVVPDSLFVRLIGGEPMVTAFWRALIAGAAIAVFVLIFMGASAFRTVFRTGLPGYLYIFLMGTTAPAFVLAVTNTSVANVVFIFASIPIFSAIFSRIFLGETVSLRMVITIAVVLMGLAVIAYGSQSNEIASWLGDIWALYISVAFAAALTAVRRIREVSMIPGIPFAYLATAILLGWMHPPLAEFDTKWPLYLGHGLTIGIASALMTLGPRYISSAEVSLLILLESVLAPLLVWLVIGEDPGGTAILGGVIVIGALIVSNLLALRNRSAGN